MKKTLIILLGTILLLTLWFLTEENDYFQADYNDLTLTEESEFTKESDPTMIYVSHFGDDKYIFRRQNVDKLKLFTNKPFIGTLTSKTLKQEFDSDSVGNNCLLPGHHPRNIEPHQELDFLRYIT